MINETEFLQNIRQLSLLTKKYVPKECWVVKTVAGRGSYAECQSKFVQIDENVFAKRVVNICYNNVYGVPVLWFNFYDLDGKLIRLECLKKLFSEAHILEGISQNEHPFLGIAFYNLHPCKTADVMRPLKTVNFVLSFLTILGSVLQLEKWPADILVELQISQSNKKIVNE